jgi:hypothetical protein
MASKCLCAVCEKPFDSKQNLIWCGKCDPRFHSNFLQTGVTETNVSASTGKCAHECDSCKKLTGDTANEHSIATCSQIEALSTETGCTASSIGDNDSLSLQLEAECVNGVCTTEMV